MPFKLNKKQLPYIALVIVVIGAAMYYLWGRPSTDEVVTADITPQSSVEATFLGLATELDSVTLDPTIFSDPRFQMLKDIHTTIISEPAGRRDPFANLPGLTASQ